LHGTFVFDLPQRRLTASENDAFIPEKSRLEIASAVDEALSWLSSEGANAASAELVELKQHQVEAVIRLQLSNIKMQSGKSFSNEVSDAMAADSSDSATPLQLLGAADQASAFIADLD
jgi:hypothetical protein